MNNTCLRCSCGEPTALYRHYDGYGNLLYVGISKSAPARLAKHLAISSWADQIHTVEVEHWNTRIEALAAEKTAIRSENPKWNINHNLNPFPHKVRLQELGPCTYISEDLSMANSDLNVMQLRLLILGMSKLEKSEDTTVRFSFTEYRDTFIGSGILVDYRSLKKSMYGLAGKTIAYRSGEVGIWVDICKIERDGGALWAVLTFSREVASSYHQGKSMVPLSAFKGLKSVYGIKLLLFILGNGGMERKVSATLEDLHHVTGATPTYKRNKRDFIRRCTESLQEEVKIPGYREVKVRKKKEGRRISEISFRLVR